MAGSVPETATVVQIRRDSLTRRLPSWTHDRQANSGESTAALSAERPRSIDGAAELATLHDGALIVYVGEGVDIAGVLLQCQGSSQYHTAPVAPCLLKGRPYRCAVFPALAPGTYAVSAITSLGAVATVEQGRVAQVDWRTALH
jgi:hypothetical protein